MLTCYSYLRSHITDGSTVCLTCYFETKNQTNAFSRLAYVTVGNSGLSFAVRWETGFEFFEPLEIQRSATTLLQNRLTSIITEIYGEGDTKVGSNHLIKPILTCNWMERKEIATDIYVFSHFDKTRTGNHFLLIVCFHFLTIYAKL